MKYNMTVAAWGKDPVARAREQSGSGDRKTGMGLTCSRRTGVEVLDMSVWAAGRSRGIQPEREVAVNEPDLADTVWDGCDKHQTTTLAYGASIGIALRLRVID